RRRGGGVGRDGGGRGEVIVGGGGLADRAQLIRRRRGGGGRLRRLRAGRSRADRAAARRRQARRVFLQALQRFAPARLHARTMRDEVGAAGLPYSLDLFRRRLLRDYRTPQCHRRRSNSQQRQSTSTEMTECHIVSPIFRTEEALPGYRPPTHARTA